MILYYLRQYSSLFLYSLPFTVKHFRSLCHNDQTNDVRRLPAKYNYCYRPLLSFNITKFNEIGVTLYLYNRILEKKYPFLIRLLGKSEMFIKKFLLL